MLTPSITLRATRAGGDPHRRLARRGAAAAAVIADAVFDVIGEIGVAGPVLVPDLAVILRPLIDIVDQEADRRAGGDLAPARLVDHHAGEDADLVGLLALRGEARPAGPSLVEIELEIGGGERDQRRAAVDDAADRRTMALAESGDAEQMAECVVGHRRPSARRIWRFSRRLAGGGQTMVQKRTARLLPQFFGGSRSLASLSTVGSFPWAQVLAFAQDVFRAFQAGRIRPGACS